MARVELSKAALDDLDRLIATHSLPVDTRQRVRRSLRHLGEHPQLGPALSGRWNGFRFVLGPWRWMIAVYAILDDDRVVIVTIQDARSSTAATGKSD